MKKPRAISDTLLTAALNDLLQLDVDAVQAYALTIKQLESRTRKNALRRYAADHKRHIRDLARLVRAHGGAPVPVSHIPTGPFKLAMQAMVTPGTDREVLLAFKSNERLSRDKYRRAAAKKHPADVARVLRRGAADEERHYRWAEKSLEKLGAGKRTAVGKAAGVAEVANARTLGAIEEAEMPIMVVAEGARRGVRALAERPVRTAAVAVAIAGAAGAAMALRKR
jgi:rubrerythrin